MPALRAPARRSSAVLGYHITFGGVLCITTILLVGLAALNSEANLLFLLFGISAGAVLFGALAPAWMIRGLEVERVVPEAVVAGKPFKLTYLVRSQRRWTSSWSLIIAETPQRKMENALPRGFVAVIPPSSEQRLELVAQLPRRGRISLSGVRVLCRFPFGLFGCAVDFEAPSEVIVYPAIGRFRRNPWNENRYSSSPVRTNDRNSGQDEFFGVREYREGDNPRWVHWRRSARTGELVVREMLPVRPTQLLIILDPWPVLPTPGGRGQARTHDPVNVEQVISAGATAICEAVERGHRVGLICRAAVPVAIAPAAGRPQRQRLLHELGLITPGEQPALDQFIGQLRWSSAWHARCMICTGRLQPVHEQVVHMLSGRAESILCLSAESEAFQSIFDLSREPAIDRRVR